jgi:hypothetical protein
MSYYFSMKKIYLTNDLVALVDDRYYQLVNKYNWFPKKDNQTIYARANITNSSGRRSGLTMHRLIMDAKPGQQVDHINGDGLDNRRANLRFSTQKQNCQNRRPRKNTSSKYKGVSRLVRSKGGGSRGPKPKGRDGWVATICISGNQKHIGVYDTEIDAAKAYDKEAKKLFGEFAWLNF